MVMTTRRDRIILFFGPGAILCLAYALFMHNLGATSLWDPDEPRQAIEAREMMERSDYIHPYLNGKPYLEKPPLYPWLIIIASKIQGTLNEVSARIPSAFAATALLIITFLAGRRMADPASGLLSAFILATNYQFLGNARESVMDMTFALFIGLTIYLGDLAIRSNRRWLFACALLPSVFAVLSKGPAGFIIAVGVLFVLLMCHNKVKAFLFPLFAGCVVSLALSSIWFIGAGKAYASEFLLHQNLTRYAKGFDHIESLFYYFPKLFFNFLPWSCLLPPAIYYAWKRKLWLPLIWFAFTFVFFEVSRSKRAIYLLPLYPAMALLVGVFLKEKGRGILENRWGSLFLKAFGVLIALIPLVGAVAPSVAIQNQRDILGAGVYGWLPLAVLALLGFAFLFFVVRKAPQKSLAALLAYLICAGFVFHSLYMPGKDRNSYSARRITEALAAVPGAHQKVYTCGFDSPAAIYYLGQPIRTVSRLDEIPQNQPGLTVIAKAQCGLSEQLASRFSPVATVRYYKGQYTIFVSQ
jgi:4-amino-4-deoxy-L-arabinose transferase-like glycosyltransferase